MLFPRVSNLFVWVRESDPGIHIISIGGHICDSFKLNRDSCTANRYCLV